MVNNVIKFKCGDIIYNNEYNHYGVILGSEYVPVFIASQNEEVVEEFVGYAWYRQVIGVLESVCLIDAIDRSAYISKNVFAEHPEVFLNECEYAFKLQWENCEEADVVFYRV